MKRSMITLALVLCWIAGFAQQAERSISIIPEPVSLLEKGGYYVLPDEVVISIPSGKETAYVTGLLKEKLSHAPGKKITVRKDKTSGDIELSLNKKTDSVLGEEGYTLNVTSQKITIRANKPAGLLYGVQTLFQLLPPQIESNKRIENVLWQVPLVEVTDYPRVGWRGMMLDVARHFFTVDEVKQYLDNMVKYKYNMFHWHLTDDEGWRIEIKSLPRLTEIGAWRTEQIGWFGGFSQPDPDAPRSYGGYYTQEEVKEVVRYAMERNIRVMPEIDVPGHSSAVLAAYPELACFPGSGDHFVRTGAPFLDWNTGGRPAAIYENTLNPASEKVYEFMDKVIEEIADLFPFEYIHTGGDEAPYTFWEKSPDVKQLMKREGLKDMAAVQSYFGKRVEKIILDKGKKMMGWDEILEGGITSTTALMSWRGVQYGIEASNSGHYVVMSPSNYVYIDLMQGDLSTDPRVYSSLRLSRTYQFDPVPDGANAKYILGGQANLWTEQVYNIRQAEYMTWPRGFAVSESLWSPASKKDWDRFIMKTEDHFVRFGYAETKYSPAMYDPVVSVKKEGDAYYVTLTPEIKGLDIYTSFDASTPDNFYPKYSEALRVPKDADIMRIITYRGDKPIGRLMSIRIEDLKKRAR
ncbi:beta-N-acetylhexosaminidase [Proteiniphilum sp. UBA1028]|uniref:beta-N-acetylhexosaminidase n=1 Tax=Proteiniphilum sp. UBA1028 TaxID=1947251 RepID=UPI000E8AA874|nr:family 20 glycosylhydrolase [Proteiniphilum sp. UBA1028]HBG56812.1 beta-N-acetylhexosaminidase [Porphyromonadaceae bacterium]